MLPHLKKTAYYTILSVLLLGGILSCIKNPFQHQTMEIDAPYYDPDKEIAERVDDLLSRMTIDEKIGQMTQIERSVVKGSVLMDYHIGSVLSGGGSTPAPNTPETWADMYDSFQKEALKTRLAIPILYGIDAVHGNNNLKGAVIFPHNIGMGCANNPELTEEAARITAIETAATGIDWTFGPCIAVARNEYWGRTYESYSESPERVSRLGRAAIRGYQGESLHAPYSILACAKHFAGDGGTSGGTDRGNTEMPMERFMDIHVSPYVDAIDAGVETVMVSFSSYNGTKMHQNRELLTGLLRDKLHFTGFVVSDWEGINEISSDYNECVRLSINAGIDMVMVPHDYRRFISTVKSEVESGGIPLSRIDDAVFRILTAKFRMGLFEKPYADRSRIQSIGSEKHRSVARRCVRESLVLLKNDGILPLKTEMTSIAVAGPFADDIGAQCGGWTITWQGQTGDITDGTTIYEGIQEYAGKNSEIVLVRDVSEAEKADAAIVVIGEEPYAEFKGDRSSLEIPEQQRKIIRDFHAQGIPVVTILLSGRPIVLDDTIDGSNAFIAAWLPGTEGGGIADVLFGKYSPTGTLSMSWPRSNEKIPVNIGDDVYDPLFEYGYGLRYDEE